MQPEHDKFDRTPALRRTPAQIADDQEMQDEARMRLAPQITDSPAVIHYKTAVASCPNLEGKGGRKDQLAENYFWQGRFEEAAMVSANPVKRAEYLEFAKAMGGEAVCSCPPIQLRSASSAKGMSVDARREIQRVFIGSFQKEVKFIGCEQCKSLFAVAG